MAVTDCIAVPSASRVSAVSVVLLATVLALPLGGCSFDLGAWGPDKEKPQAADQKPTGTISGQNVSEAQGYAARGLERFPIRLARILRLRSSWRIREG